MALWRRFIALFLACICSANPLLADCDFAYVTTSSNVVQKIDLSTNTVTATIGEIPPYIINTPTFIAYSSSTNLFYYTNQFGNTVGVLNPNTNTILRDIRVGSGPLDIAINTAGDTAYVTNGNSSSLSIINLTAVPETVTTVPLGAGTNPRGVALTPTKAYVVNANLAIVSVINLTNNSVSTIANPAFADAIEVVYDPAKNLVYVTSLNGTLAVINPVNDTVIATFSTFGEGSRGIDITNDGLKAFIANADSNTVTVIDLNTGLLVIPPIPVGAGVRDVVLSPNELRAYAINTNADTVSIIDTTTYQVINTFPVGFNPRSIGITSDGKIGYVINLGSSTVSVVNLVGDAGTLITTITNVPGLLFLNPYQPAINPTATLVYIPNNTGNPTFGVGIVNIATNTIVGEVLATSNAGVVAITPDGTKAYVTNQDTPVGFVTVIDLATNTVIAFIEVGDSPYGIAITPDGTRAYVANNNQDNGSISVIDTATNTVIDTILNVPGANNIQITPNGTTAYVSGYNDSIVYVINLANNSIITTIPVGVQPEGIAITPDGKKAFVANTISGTVSVIDTTANSVIATITVGSTPLNISISPDGTTAYVTVQGANQVVIIDIATNTIIGNIPTALLPVGIVIAPDQAPVASFTVNAVNSPTVTFDASASSSPCGTIVSYAWDFGDGQTTVTSTPVVSHTYRSFGNFAVRLTVTNSAGTSTTKVFTGQTLLRNGGLSATTVRNVNIAQFIFPPSNVKGKQIVKERKDCKFKVVNVLTWSAPSTGNAPVEYRIYSDAALTQLVGSVSGSQLTFKDRHANKREATVYFIVSVDASGAVSSSLRVVVKPKACKDKSCERS